MCANQTLATTWECGSLLYYILTNGQSVCRWGIKATGRQEEALLSARAFRTITCLVLCCKITHTLCHLLQMTVFLTIARPNFKPSQPHVRDVIVKVIPASQHKMALKGADTYGFKPHFPNKRPSVILLEFFIKMYMASSLDPCSDALILLFN